MWEVNVEFCQFFMCIKKVMWFFHFYFVNMLINFLMLNQLCIPRKNPYWYGILSFYVLLNLICYHFVRNSCIYVYERQWSHIVFISYTGWYYFFLKSCFKQFYWDILSWSISWTEKPSRLQSMGSHWVGHDWSNLAHTWCQEVL